MQSRNTKMRCADPVNFVEYTNYFFVFVKSDNLNVQSREACNILAYQYI